MVLKVPIHAYCCAELVNPRNRSSKNSMIAVIASTLVDLDRIKYDRLVFRAVDDVICKGYHKSRGFVYITPCRFKKGTSRQRSGKGAIRKRFPLQKPRWEKTKLSIRYFTMKTYRKPYGQLFFQYVATQLPKLN